MNSSIGNWLIIVGSVLLVAGLLAKSGVFAWFGHLPGDLHIKRDGFQFFFPLASMIVVSVALTLIVNLLRKFW